MVSVGQKSGSSLAGRSRPGASRGVALSLQSPEGGGRSAPFHGELITRVADGLVLAVGRKPVSLLCMGLLRYPGGRLAMSQVSNPGAQGRACHLSL